MVSTATMQKRALATSFFACQNPKRLIKTCKYEVPYTDYFSVLSLRLEQRQIATGKYSPRPTAYWHFEGKDEQLSHDSSDKDCSLSAKLLII